MAVRKNPDGSITVGIIPGEPAPAEKVDEPVKVEKPKKAKIKKGEG